MVQSTNTVDQSRALDLVELDPSLLALVAGGSPKGTWIDSLGSPKGTWEKSDELSSPKGTW